MLFISINPLLEGMSSSVKVVGEKKLETKLEFLDLVIFSFVTE